MDAYGDLLVQRPGLQTRCLRIQMAFLLLPMPLTESGALLRWMQLLMIATAGLMVPR